MARVPLCPGFDEGIDVNTTLAAVASVWSNMCDKRGKEFPSVWIVQ